jgi:hypothetical protein
MKSRFDIYLLLAFILAGVLPTAIAEPPASITIRSAKDQLNIAWSGGLGLVQPQSATQLDSISWKDLGSPTTTTNLFQSVSTNRSFYRLRFLAPEITNHPQSQTNTIGGSVSFAVTATGTAPLQFQWRKNGTALVGQINPALSITNVIASDQGDYSVVIGNRVGAVTSIVATLSVKIALPPAAGIYMGKFADQTNNAGFAIMVRTNGSAIVLAAGAPKGGNLLVTNIVVNSNGGFSSGLTSGGTLTGTLGTNAVSGTLLNTNGTTVAFTGARKPNTGPQQTNSGYYAGEFEGLLTGELYGILAADGTIFTFLSSELVGKGGSFGMISAANTLSSTNSFLLPGATTPGIIKIDGTLNPTTRQIVGNYGTTVFNLGTFLLKRVSAP